MLQDQIGLKKELKQKNRTKSPSKKDKGVNSSTKKSESVEQTQVYDLNESKEIANTMENMLEKSVESIEEPHAKNS